MMRSMEPLSLRLRDETRDLHEWVEDHPFNQDLFSGRISMTRYGQYLLGLLATAESLERALGSELCPPELAGLQMPDFFRSSALKEDILHFPPSDVSSPELARYLEGPAVPSRIAAMAYVRWMGDLGGGQIIARRLADAWHLQSGRDHGLSVYVFPKPVGELRHRLRNALDAIPFSEAEVEDTVLAAREIFELHESWFSLL